MLFLQELLLLKQVESLGKGQSPQLFVEVELEEL